MEPPVSPRGAPIGSVPPPKSQDAPKAFGELRDEARRQLAAARLSARHLGKALRALARTPAVGLRLLQERLRPAKA